jgi:hypothetical protein
MWGPRCQVNITVVGLEVLTAVVMKSTVFWDITLCSLMKNISLELKNKPSKKTALKQVASIDI